jgi:hypothetical protein
MKIAIYIWFELSLPSKNCREHTMKKGHIIITEVL